MRKNTLDIQQVLRWIIMAIVMMVAIVLLSAVLKVAGFLMGYAVKGLIILLLAAIAIRFFSMLKERR